MRDYTDLALAGHYEEARRPARTVSIRCASHCVAPAPLRNRTRIRKILAETTGPSRRCGASPLLELTEAEKAVTRAAFEKLRPDP